MFCSYTLFNKHSFHSQQLRIIPKLLLPFQPSSGLSSSKNIRFNLTPKHVTPFSISPPLFNTTILRNFRKTQTLRQIPSSKKMWNHSHYSFSSSKQTSLLSKEEAIFKVRSLFETAMAYHEQINLPEALKHYSEALSLAKKAQLPDSIDIACIKNNMGDIYLRQGDFDKAQKHIEKAGKLLEKFSQNNELRPQITKNVFTKAVLYLQQGDLDKAFEAYQDTARMICETPEGNTIAILIMTYEGLGQISHKRMKLSEAIEYWEKGLDVIKTNFGEDTFEAHTFLDNLAWAFQERAQFEQALLYAEKGLKLRVKRYGEDTLDTGSSLFLLGNIYFNKGEYEKALQIDGKALELLKSHPTKFHDQIASTYELMARTYFFMNDYLSAEKMFNSARKILSEEYGEQSLLLAKCYVFWADLLCRKRELKPQAKSFYAEALKIYRNFGLTDQPKVIRIYFDLGEITYYEDELEEALEWFSQCLKLSLEIPQKPRPLEEIYSFLGAIHLRLDQYDECKENYEKAVQACQGLDNSSGNLDLHCRNLGVICERKGLLENAKDAYTKTLDISVKKYGLDNEITKEVVDLVLNVLLKMNDKEKANMIAKLYGSDK